MSAHTITRFACDVCHVTHDVPKRDASSADMYKLGWRFLRNENTGSMGAALCSVKCATKWLAKQFVAPKP